MPSQKKARGVRAFCQFAVPEDRGIMEPGLQFTDPSLPHRIFSSTFQKGTLEFQLK